MATSPDNKNYDFCKETVALKTNAEMAFLELGGRLHKIKKEEMFKPFWSSFHEFELEFKWQPSTATRLIKIYKKFVVELDIPKERLAAAGGWTVLAEIEPMVQDKESAEKWLEKTETHSRADIRKDVQEAKGKLPEDSGCKHPPAEVYYLKICGACGLKEQYYPPDKTIRRSGKGMAHISKHEHTQKTL